MSSSATISSDIQVARWEVPYYVRGLALGIPIYFVAIHIWTWVLIVPGSLAKSGYDFRQIYGAAYAVRTGHARELYDYALQTNIQDDLVSRTGVALPYVSPSYEALFLSPLSLLGFKSAYVVFVAVNFACLGICFVLLRPWMANLRAVFWWLPVALFLGFLPVAAALIEGQDSILLTTLLVGAYVFLTVGKNLSAGAAAGLAFFKFPVVLPIALLFLIWRRWRFVAGFSISALAVIVLSIWLTGVPQTKLYIDSLMSIAGLRHPTSGLSLYPVNWKMMANVHGFTVGLADKWIPESSLHLITIVASAAVLAWTALSGMRVQDPANLLLLAIPCSVLVGHHTYIHDLSVLLLPMIVLLTNFLPAEAVGGIRERLIGRSAALMFVAPIIESFSPGQFYVVTPVIALLLFSAARAGSSSGPDLPAPLITKLA